MNNEIIHQKNAIIISLILLLTFSLVLGFVALTTISSVDGQRSKSERQAQATLSAAESELTTARRQAEVAQSLALAAQARQTLERGESNLAIAIALEAVNIDNPPAEAELMLSEAAYAPGILRQISLPNPWTSGGMAIHPNAQMLVYGTVDGEIVVMNLHTGVEIRRFGRMTGGITSVEFSPDGRNLFTSAGTSIEDSYAIWDFESGQQIASLAGYESERTPNPTFSADGQILYLTDGYSGSITVWDVHNDRSLGHTATIPNNYLHDFAISPDGQNRMVSLYNDPNRIVLWSLTTNEILQEYTGFTDYPLAVTFAPGGLSFFTGGGEGGIIQWEVATGNILRRFNGHKLPVSALAVSPDGRKLLSNADGAILWDIATGEILNRFPYTQGTALAFSPDGQMAVVGPLYQDYVAASILDLQVGTMEQRFLGHTAAPIYVAFPPDSTTAISVGSFGSIENGFTLWNTQTGLPINRFEEGLDLQIIELNSAALSPDGQRLLNGFAYGGAILWDITRGKVIQHFDAGQKMIQDVALSADGKFAAAGTQPSSLIVWDVASGNIVHQIDNAHENRVIGVAFSPDSQSLVTGSMDNPVIMWDVDTGKQIQQFFYNNSDDYASYVPRINSIAFSPDGTFVLAVYGNNTVAIWDVQTAELKHMLLDASSAIFSTNRQQLLVLTSDNHLEVWDADTWHKIRRWYVGGGFDWATPPTHLAFSFDGRQALAINRDSTMTSWRVDTLDEMIDWIHNNRYVPTLTCEQLDQFRVVPLCAEGIRPMPIPYYTWTPEPTIENAVALTATVAAYVTPTMTPSATSTMPFTSTPTMTP
jgi:WD40 repeat protein